MGPRAIILAAGRGDRLRPLTDLTPKPLLQVGNWRLIEWHLNALAHSGVRDVVVNTAWLEEQFPAALGDGSRFGLRIHWSFERAEHGGALETAGGIRKALPLLGECFWVVSGDVFIPDFVFETGEWSRFGAGADLAHLWMVSNPPHHPHGDFTLDGAGRLSGAPGQRMTWASVGLFRAELFAGLAAGRPFPLRPLLESAALAGRLGGAPLRGHWVDVGTAERLSAARTSVSAAKQLDTEPLDDSRETKEKRPDS